MKIAWGKFGGAITYGSDALLGTAGGVNMNSRYIRQLLEMGHDVFPIVPLTRKSDPWPGSSQSPIQEADLVIIENGPNSLLSQFRGVPAITYLLTQLAEYTGPVIYLQSDPDLPFSFFPEHFTPKWYGQGPDSIALQKERKDWYVVTSCRYLDKLIARCSGKRYQYNNVPSNVKFRTIELHDILADSSIRFNEEPASNDLGVYIGGERRLCKKFIDYTNRYMFDLYGKWKDASLARLGTEAIYRGILGDGLVTDMYGSYPHSLVMGNKDYEDVGMIAARFWETTMSGCYPLVDIALPKVSPLVLQVAPDTIEQVMPTNEICKSMAWNLRQDLLNRNKTLGDVMSRVILCLAT